MPRYYLHVENDEHDQHDADGAEFAGEHVALAEAARLAGEIGRDEALAGKNSFALRVMVADADNRSVGSVTLALGSG